MSALGEGSSPRRRGPDDDLQGKLPACRADEAAVAEIVRANVEKIFSPEFTDVMLTESMGGPGRPGRVGVNGVVDGEGRILSFGNNPPQAIMERVDRRELFRFGIRAKVDGRADGPDFDLYYDKTLPGGGRDEEPPQSVKDVLRKTVEAACRDGRSHVIRR